MILRKPSIIDVGSVVLATLALFVFEIPVHAQVSGEHLPASPPSDAGDPSGSPTPQINSTAPGSKASSQPKEYAESISPSTDKTKAALYYFLLMSGRTQTDFKRLTAEEKVKFYAKGLFSPFHFIAAAGAAGITQWEDVPTAWGQGAEGFGRRFGNYFAKQTVERTVRLGGEELLHEDNRYFGSGEHGFGRRVWYAIESSVLARRDDGSRRISISQIGATASSAFISRLWQPATNNSAGDGAVSFGIGMGTNAGLNVFREFLPDVLKHVFRHNEATGPQIGSATYSATTMPGR